METFLITGANRGLGLELVRSLVARPDTFVVAAIRSNTAPDLLDIAAQYPDRLLITPMDVTDQESILAAAAVVSRKVPCLDVLINNAAGHPPAREQSFEAVTHDQMMEVFEMNAVGPLLVVQAFLELLKRSPRPRIINISSERGSLAWQAGHGGYYSYSLGKAGLNMLTRLLAVDLAPYSVTTISIHPGWMRTKMGGASAMLSPAESARGILELTHQLTPGQNGGFYQWDGEAHPW
jgi:NAD(P)-dependent dehydrogenase (short-subunit alcohol dehydrogenase family)